MASSVRRLVKQVPLTTAQRGIWFAHLIAPDAPMSIAAHLEFRDALHLDLLAEAGRRTASDTETPLTRLREVDGDLVLEVDHTTDMRIDIVEFADAADPVEAAEAWMYRHRTRQVDLLHTRLVECYLLRLAPDHLIFYCWAHHMVCDGFAATIMFARLGEHYAHLVAGTEAPPLNALGFDEIEQLDRAYRASAQFESDRRYWADTLGARPEPFRLSDTDAPPAAVATTESITLSANRSRQVREAAEAMDVRVASLMTAAFGAYLALVGGREHAMISLPVAARRSDELRRSAGMMSNVLPIAVPVRPDRSIAELMTATNESIRTALRHQQFRHEDISREFFNDGHGLEHRGFYGPMVNVMMFFGQMRFGDVVGDVHVVATGPVEDMSLNVYEGLDGMIRIDLEANPNRYPPDVVRAHHERFVGFLRRMVSTGPAALLGRIDTVTPDELRSDRVWNATVHQHPAETLLDLLDEGRAVGHERTAVTAADPDDPFGDLTHLGLHRRADHLACRLIDEGVGVGDIVAVALSRSVNQVIALLGVLRAGAAFLPVDPTDPGDRIDHVLGTAHPSAIITSTTAAQAIRERTRPETAVIEVGGEFAAGDDARSDAHIVAERRRSVHPAHAAYVLFTSGSTGRPKGVIVTHEAIANRLRWMQDRYRLTDDDVVLQKTPATFDVAVWEFFWPMATGATLVVATPDGHRDPWFLREAIRRHRVTALHFVPSMLAAFTGAFIADAEAPVDLTSVRVLFTSGEALASSTVRRWSELSDAPVHNLYGPTEAAIDVTHWDDCDPTVDTIPIGRPVWNTTAYVLDRRLRVQATGHVGELYLGGIQLARGYVNRPDLTADRFLADPFVAGRRMYRTGDLVRRRGDGVLEYVGRTDFQLKIRGQRVELGEIEAALRRLVGVRDAVVVALRDADRHRLVGYVTASDESTTPADTRARLRDVLPVHMVPDAVVVLDALPTTPNGKLDRTALPRPDFGADAAVADATGSEPTDATERTVSDAFARTLGLPRMAMDAGFFDLGGNSLMATQLAMELAAEFGRRVTVKTVFDAPTPRAMASMVGGGTAARPARPLARIEPTSRPARIPLSPAQQRLWFINRIDPASGVYNLAVRISLRGALDIEALRGAFLDVVGKHQALRTVFPSDSIGPRQQIVDVVDPAQIITASTTGSDPHVDDMPSDEFVTAGFDLARELPIRARLSGAADHHELDVVIHHIATDGWSLRPLASDLTTAYRARVQPEAPPLEPLAVQYADYTLWHRSRIGAEDEPDSVSGHELAYWAEQLAELPAEAELPRDRPRSAETSMRGRSTRITLTPDVHHRLREIAAEAEVGMFMVVHALVATLLRLFASEDDIVVGTPVAGRPDRRLDDLVGMFVNTVVLRVAVSKSDSFLDVVNRCRAVDVAAIDASETPFDRIVELLNPPRSDFRHPLFQVSVALDEAEAIPLEFVGVAAVAEPIDTGLVKFDVDITATESVTPEGEAGGLSIRIGYATDLFADSTMTEFGARLAMIARAVTVDPTASVGDVQVLHRHEQVALVPAAGQAPRRPETYAEMIADAVAADPDHVAIRYEGRSATYAEIDRRSNVLARALIHNGVAPEQYVAIAIPRSIEWIVAMWAVTKAGAAWVPVDLRYPAERITHLLRDSGARLVLVSDGAALPGASAGDRVVIDVAAESAVDDVTGHGAEPITDDDRIAPVRVDNPAYLIYTSGTTGTPKGVVVSHRGLVNFAAEQMIRFDVTAHSRTLHFASPSFDASILESLMAVGSGATMVIAPTHILGGRELDDLLRAERVSHAFVTPAVLGTLMPGLPDLEVVVVGGEAPNPETVAEWAEHHDVFNAYGPTESTVVATISDPVTPGDAVTIGRPTRGTDLLVLDERLAPVPTGAIGELYLSGSQLARGYHGRRGRTSQSFVANPYSHSGDRMYRTGDLVRWNGDGELDFVGRADTQVKVRGFRIELGEIDAALVRDDVVAEATTITRVGPDGTGHLISYIRPESGDDGIGEQEAADLVDTAALRERLSAVLPSHMVPSAVVALRALPRTPTGKVDHRALPTPSAADGQVEPARTAVERIVADVFASALGVGIDEVGRTQSFFDVGGTSLMGTQVVAAMEQVVGERIPVRTLFDTPTVSGLAQKYAEPLSRVVDGGVIGGDLVPLVLDPDRPPVGPVGPLAAAGESLWFLNRLDPESGSYNIAFAIDLTGALDIDALGAALIDVVDRHLPLRSVYPETGGRPATVAIPATQVVGALTPVAVDDPRADAQTLARSTFDLRTDPPLRARLYRTAPDHHELAIVIHHIAADGWSLGPLARDIGTAYVARRDGMRPQFFPLPVTYADYVDWQAQVLGDPGSPDSHHAALVGWWTERLAGIPDRAPLPVDRPPTTDLASSEREQTVRTVDLVFADADVDRLRATASANDMSVFMVVHGVLAALLARMSTDPDVAMAGAPADVVIGTPVAGRRRTELADLVGMFVNAVTLRVDVRRTDTVVDLLTRVREVDVDALSRTDIPFDRVVQACNPERVGTQHPLFQVVLAFADDTPPPIDLGGLTVATREIDTQTSRFDLEVRMTGSQVRFTYDTALFDHGTVVDLAHRFTVMAAAFADPAARIADVDLLTDVERAQIVLRDDAAAPEPRLLPAMMADAATRPDAVALVGVDATDLGRSSRQVSYGELDARSNQWARLLIGHDIGPGSIVAVAIGRSIESVTAVWAVAKTGAAFLPVDPDYPPERISHMLGDSEVALGLTTAAVVDRLPTSVRWLPIDESDTDGPAEDLAAIVATLAAGPVRPRMRTRPLHLDDLAYVIYTSGSTGTPKGVAVTHRGLAAVSDDQRRRYGVTPDSRTLHFASPSFDASVLELLLAVTAGSTMVICPPGVFGGGELTTVARAHRVTHAFITPAALATVDPDLPDLRVIGVGGEACGPELVERWTGPDRLLLNNYGPTETTIVATSATLTPGTPVTIGTPLRGSHALVLDRALRPVPANTPGELYLAGDGVARGYRGRPGLTATRFVAHPVHPGQRMYRTGDLVIAGADGRLRYLGRTDTQVKIRGFRIELGEVESALLRCTGVTGAAATVRGDADQAVLIAYVSGTSDTDSVRRSLRARLPRHLIPASVVAVDAIPMTSNGKLDRAALPDPRPAGPTEPSSEIPPLRRPRTETESVLVDIVGAAIGVDPNRIDPDADFFDLGGTSLVANQVVAAINTHAGTTFRVRTVFDHPTLADLAQLIDTERDSGGDGPAQSALTHRSHPDGVGLAPAQRRLWFLHRADPGSAAYHLPLAVTLVGPLDVDALHRACVDVVDRHVALRTRYPEVDGVARQIPMDDALGVVGARLEIRECSEAALPDLLTGEAFAPFDLAHDPPVRFRLYRTDPQRHHLLMVVHHLAADGWSLSILIGDLRTAYRARSAGKVADPAPQQVDYLDVSEWQLQSLGTLDDPRSLIARQIAFWRAELAGAPIESLLPGDHRPPPVRDGRGASVTVDIPIGLRSEMAEVARGIGGSAFMVLHTALAILMARMGVGTDVVVGTPTAGRNHPDLATVVGMFVNTVALRTRLRPDQTVREALDVVRDRDLEAFAHGDVPFDDVVAAINPERSPGRHPILQTVLSVHEWTEATVAPVDRDADLAFEIAEITAPAAKFDLQFTVTGVDPGAGAPCRLSVTYASDRYAADTVESFAQRFVRVLAAVVADPDAVVGDIAITDTAETQRLWPVRGHTGPYPRTFDALIGAAVTDNPDGLAVRDATGDHTYRQLDEASNRLARHLLAHGARPNEVIAMALRRSAKAVVATWAIVKAGAAHLPVDPDYPTGRIEHMLADSGARMGVTDTEHLAALPDSVSWLPADAPDVEALVERHPAGSLSRSTRPRISVDQGAYTIYTSGSTGRPKGVVVSHRGLAAIHDELQARMRTAPGSRVLAFASPSFDASVLEMMLALSGRSALVIAPTDVYGGADLQTFLAANRITHAFITPAALAGIDPDDVATVGTVGVGGEAVSDELARRWSPGRTLVNFYGPSEATVFATASAALDSTRPVDIGGPIRGVRVLVLDDRLHPVPVGVPGDLYLVGDGLATGYHRRMDLTASRFVACPTGIRGDRMYRTGDIVRWNRHGALDYLGRNDDQVQVRGFRIEPGEIDAAVSGHPSVRFAATTVTADIIATYVVPTAESTVDPVELRSFVAQRVPRHMVPAVVMVIPAIPLTPSGKLDRSALPAPVVDAGVGRAPRPGLETQISDAFAEVLHCDQVSADDNFFLLGGTSLTGTTLVALLRERYSLAVGVQALFTSPTPAELARHLGRDGSDTDAAFAVLLPLRAEGDRVLFAIHPAAGLAWSYAGLLPHLDEGIALYGVQNPTLSGGEPTDSIAELAGLYVDHMVDVAGGRPISLIGWSVGGLIAQEVAIQLADRGRDVDGLTLLDTYVVAGRDGFDTAPSVADLAVEFGLVEADSVDPALDVDGVVPLVARMDGPYGALGRDRIAALYDSYRHTAASAGRWQPRRWSGPLRFVTATVDPPPGRPALDDWTDLVSAIDETRIACRHSELLTEPHVAQLMIPTSPGAPL